MNNVDIHIDENMIPNLLSDQAPHLASLQVKHLRSSGTDNVLFRLGDRLVLRLPRREPAAVLLQKELEWLPHLNGLYLRVPVLVARGYANFGFKCEFGVFEWIDGQIASPKNISDPVTSASALAEFLKTLQLKDITGAPPAGTQNNRRGISLEGLSNKTVAAIDILADEIDAAGARKLWEAACAETCRESPVWLHGDLKADNLIADDGRLMGVIDWGLSAVGDPAADHAAAWSWVDPIARGAFREALGLEESDWLRAKGWALYGAVIALSYYRGGRNEALSLQSRQTLSRLDLAI